MKKQKVHYIFKKPLPQPTVCGLSWGVRWDDDKRAITCDNCLRVIYAGKYNNKTY